MDTIKLLIEKDKSLLKIIELHFFGDQKDCIEVFDEYKFLKNNIFLHDYLDKNEAMKKMLDSDILINLGNDTDYQLPSKIIDYVSARRPILNICSIKNDSTKMYLEKFSFVLNYFQDGNIKILYDFIKNSKKINIKENEINSFLNKHSANVLAKKYLSLINVN